MIRVFIEKYKKGKNIMQNNMKTLILSGFLTLNLVGSAPAPVQPALLSPAEIKSLIVPENAPDSVALSKDWAIRDLITGRGIDLAVLDAYLAQDRRFSKMHNWTFATFMSAIYNANLPLFEYVLANHPDAINKKDEEENSPLNQILRRITLNKGAGEEIGSKLPIWRTMIRLLVDHGADKESPSYFISWEGLGNIKRYVRNYSGTPLLQAIDIADYNIVAFLVNQGANLEYINGNTALETAKKLRNRNPQIYDKIITLLELANYKRSRLENAVLQRGLVQKNMPKDTNYLIAEYVTGFPSPEEAQAKRAAINEIKKELKAGDLESLISFINKYPEINVQDEAGDSLLLLAIRAQNSEALKLILEKLTQLDQAKKGINARLIKALGHIDANGDNAYALAQKLNNQEIIAILRPYYNAPETAPQPMEE